MKIGKLRTLIEGKSDSELVFIAWYDRDEVDEFIGNHFDNKTDPVTDEEWITIYSSMVDDERVFQELNESFRYYIDKVMEDRAKGKADVNSK
jgi:hypothetical protein